jgi:hypothetical protein
LEGDLATVDRSGGEVLVLDGLVGGLAAVLDADLVDCATE